jgi:hypothetical protein
LGQLSASVLIVVIGSPPFYFSLPSAFRGNQVYSAYHF